METELELENSNAEQSISENNSSVPMNKNNVSDLSLKEKKEKILLEFYYLRDQIDKIEDKEISNSLNKIVKELEKETTKVFAITVPLKVKKNYIKLKNSEIDLNLLKLTKFL